MKMRPLHWLAAAAFSLGLSAAPALAEDTGPAIEQFTLSNGMDVVVIPDTRAPVVTHMVWYKVGAVDEEPGKSGMAHLFEHVMSHATDDLGHREIDTIVARNGGRKNAFTSWDYTAYYERVAKQHLPRMMELEAERMTDLIIDAAQDKGFVAERDVVKEERRQRYENNPNRLLQEKVFAAFWKGHPYEIMTIGKMDEVAGLSVTDGQYFYSKYYTPDNATLVIAGDVTPEYVRTLAEEKYGAIQPKGGGEVVRKWTEVQPIAETQLITHSDPKVRQPRWNRYYMGTSAIRDPKTAHALNVGLQVLGGGQTSRLYQTLVEDQKIANDVGTFAWTGLHDTGPAVLYGSPSQGVSLEELETAVMAEVYASLAEGFSEADVKRARNRLAAQSIYARDNQYDMASLVGRTLTSGGSIDSILTYPEDVKAVTAAEALAAVRSVFAEDKNYIEAHLLPAEGDF